jgi:hypothetical protein
MHLRAFSHTHVLSTYIPEYVYRVDRLLCSCEIRRLQVRVVQLFVLVPPIERTTYYQQSIIQIMTARGDDEERSVQIIQQL